MHISKLNKNNYINNHQKTLKFGDDWHVNKNESHEIGENEEKDLFINLSDDDLHAVASAIPNAKYRQVKKNLVATFFVGAPVASIVASGIAKTGNLSSKLNAMAKTSGKWCTYLGLVLGLVFIKDKVNKKSKLLNNINNDHPVISLGMDGAFLLGTLSLLKNAKNVLHNIIPTKIKNTISNIRTPIKNFINNTSLNKKIVYPLDRSLVKLSKGNLAPVKIAANWAGPTVIVAGLLRNFAESKSRKKNIEINYNTLKGIQTVLKNQKLNQV